MALYCAGRCARSRARSTRATSAGDTACGCVRGLPGCPAPTTSELLTSPSPCTPRTRWTGGDGRPRSLQLLTRGFHPLAVGHQRLHALQHAQRLGERLARPGHISAVQLLLRLLQLLAYLRWLRPAAFLRDLRQTL